MPDYAGHFERSFLQAYYLNSDSIEKKKEASKRKVCKYSNWIAMSIRLQFHVLSLPQTETITIAMFANQMPIGIKQNNSNINKQWRLQRHFITTDPITTTWTTYRLHEHSCLPFRQSLTQCWMKDLTWNTNTSFTLIFHKISRTNVSRILTQLLRQHLTKSWTAHDILQLNLCNLLFKTMPFPMARRSQFDQHKEGLDCNFEPTSHRDANLRLQWMWRQTSPE